MTIAFNGPNKNSGEALDSEKFNFEKSSGTESRKTRTEQNTAAGRITLRAAPTGAFLLYESCGAGGKPSTRFPPGGLVGQECAARCCPKSNDS